MNDVELKLKSFFDECKIEVRKETEKYHGGSVSAWVKYYDIWEFVQIFDSSLFDDEGVESNMREDCLWLDFGSILEFYEIDEDYFI